MRCLKAFLDNRLVGTLSEGDDLWTFAYDDAWITDPHAFDLAPDLPRAKRHHADGGTLRHVQWYFDNLLPEEMLRQAIQKEAGIKGDDAFALLTYLGAESAGSLTLLPETSALPQLGHLQPLSNNALSARIAGLPKQTLTAQSPKRMSLAGAQHKLLIVALNGTLYEPEGATPSTHLLKPAHPDVATYPASVANEFVTMRLAAAAQLPVPSVDRLYVPDPVYVVDRFDREVTHHGYDDEGRPKLEVRRRHIIDACQLLGRSRLFKHSGASLDALNDIIARTTNKLLSRTQLFRWIVFNVAIGNDDCHLKNLSFFVSREGVRVAPHYDLLATGVYSTKAFADDKASWPQLEMAIPLPGATTFADVSFDKLLEAGIVLGLSRATAIRIITDVTKRLLPALDKEIMAQERAHARAGEPAKVHFAAESRLLLVLKNIVLREMVGRLTP